MLHVAWASSQVSCTQKDSSWSSNSGPPHASLSASLPHPTERSDRANGALSRPGAVRRSPRRLSSWPGSPAWSGSGLSASTAMAQGESMGHEEVQSEVWNIIFAIHRSICSSFNGTNLRKEGLKDVKAYPLTGWALEQNSTLQGCSKVD